jgi:antirestriction protein ArdC
MDGWPATGLANTEIAKSGITCSPRPDHARCLSSWLKVLKADNRAVFTAASAAEGAEWFSQAYA